MSKTALLFSFICFCFFYSNMSYSNTYYVDAIEGDDNNTGLSPLEAWKTVRQVNITELMPGDNILFKSGQKWNEQLVPSGSGSPGSPITFSSYDIGNKPIISGSELLEEFSVYSGSIWQTTTLKPQQVFFDNIRGALQISRGGLNAEKEWFYDTTSSILYIYSSGNPLEKYTSPGIEVSYRPHCVYLYNDFITIENLQLEKCYNSAINISSFASDITINNIDFYQWSFEPNWEGDGDGIPAIGGVDIYGPGCTVSNSTFGKKTGDDIADQNWAGFVGIHIAAPNTKIADNNFFHNGLENEIRVGDRAIGILISSTSGVTEISENYFYHNGGHSILIRTNTRIGDTIKIFDNTMEYPGQAGISAYATRGSDGVGGIGLIYRNNVSFANRLGGDWGSSGNQSSGIHLNDGVVANVDNTRPFMKWYVYENVIHNTQARKKPNGLDSDGIGLDFNANNAEVFRNIVYNNWGKGIYLWNANRCKVSYNIIYGNDCGSTITAATGTLERAENNEFFNNTYYKNYNGDSIGPNYHAEIYFGGNGKNNLFKNNIFYGHEKGVIYYFRNQNTSGCVTDNNVVYKTGGFYGWDSNNKSQSFEQWKANHPAWDLTTIKADPMFVDASSGNFELSPLSPAINKGLDLGLTNDFRGNPFNGAPDIGAFEYGGVINPEPLVIKSADIHFYHRVNVKFSRKIALSTATDASNYTISNNISVLNAIVNEDETEVTLETSEHIPGENYSISVNNIYDEFGNMISSQGNTYSYFFNIDLSNNIGLFAESASLSEDAKLRIKKNSAGTQVVYCSSTSGEIRFNVSLPDSGVWYVWARMFYELSSSSNSFFIRADNDTNQILGDDSRSFDVWHWDGYKGNKVRLGFLSAGEHSIVITGREQGLNVLIDQILLTRDPFLVPFDSITPKYKNITLEMLDGVPSGEIILENQEGSISQKTISFNSDTASVQFQINFPTAGKWFAWGRMFAASSAENNYFYIKVDDGDKLILGGQDLFTKWYWNGLDENRLELGDITQGEHTLTTYGSSSGQNLILDLLQLSNNPDYIPYEKSITSVGEQQITNSVYEFNLQQNYPNPFNPSTHIKFSVPVEGHVSLKLYNILGKEILTLVDEVKPSGAYNMEFNAGKLNLNLASGIYFYVLRAGNYSSTKKMILLK